ncbi:MAG: hypothetical protein WCF57_16190 [Pyrinomonadaceae bacterium]
MKRCPTCQSTYTDESLKFCLQDGAALVSANDSLSPVDSPETLRYDARTAPTVETPKPAAHTTPQLRTPTRDTQLAAPRAPSSNRALTAGVIIIAALLLALVGIGAALLLRQGAPEGNRNAGVAQGNNGARDSGANGNTESAVSPAANTNNAEARPLKMTASASSTRARYRGIDYGATNAVDASLATAWAEGATGPGLGEWIRCDFDREVALRRIIIAPGYFKSPQVWARNNRVAAATLYFSDGSSRELRFPDRMEEQKIDLGAIRSAWVRLVINEVYLGADPDTAISQLSFDWEQ